MALTLKWKIIIPVIVILAIVAGYLQYKNKIQNISEETPINIIEQEEQGQPAATTEIASAVPPVATGNIDDTINALLQDSSGETKMFQEEMTEANAVSDDSQAIGELGQSYNENEF
jgi:hypothetical protein